MDNCGFHHARHVEPLLRNMLGLSGVDLVFQPPYRQVQNTGHRAQVTGHRSLFNLYRKYPKHS